MNMYPSLQTGLFAATLIAGALFQPCKSLAQNTSSTVSNYVDRILGRPTSNSNVVDRNSDTLIDVRDLVIYINGLPTAASFGTTESRVFPTQNSIDLPLYFTKPASGRLRIELSGSAVNGTDYGNFGAAVVGFENIIREINLTNAKIATLTVPLLSDPKEFRGERRLVLTLRSLATLNGTQVDRSAGPAPGSIPTHTIIISEGEKVWSGTIDFTRESGFGSLLVSFALTSSGSLRFAIRDSKFFRSALPSSGQTSMAGDLEFIAPLAGTFQMASGGPPAPWSLQFARLPATNSPGFLPIAQYSAQLQIQAFPVGGITRGYTAQLTLVPSR